MTKLKLIVFSACLCCGALLHAADQDAVIFPGAAYPLRISLSPGEKTGDIIYQSPLSAAMRAGYDTVLMQGEMPDPGVKLEIWVKSRSLFKAYDQYKEPAFKRFPDGRFWARFPVSPTKQPLRLVIRSDGAKAGQLMTVYELETAGSAALKEAQDAAEEPAPPAPAAQDEAPFSIEEAIPFTLVRREAWQAAPPKEPYIRHVPRAFTLHHTAGRAPKTLEEAVSEIQFIQDYHQNAKGWIDIGYHFLVDPLGNIYEGRPMYAVGAHVLYRNTDNIGISMMGNYHPPASDQPSQKALDSFAQAGKYLKDNYSIAVSSFHSHREIGSTDCPGDILHARMPVLKEIIYAPAPPQAGTEGAARPGSEFLLWTPEPGTSAPRALRQLLELDRPAQPR